jgi:hypothetical protein
MALTDFRRALFWHLGSISSKELRIKITPKDSLLSPLFKYKSEYQYFVSVDVHSGGMKDPGPGFLLDQSYYL